MKTLKFNRFPGTNRRRNENLNRRRPAVELLEDRQLLAVAPLTLTDPSFWGDTGYGQSSTPDLGQHISADGQRVVFTSDANNLVANDDNNATDVFLFDRGSGETTLISLDATGTKSGNFASNSPSISADGRYVAYFGEGGNAFVRDLTRKTTTLISRTFAGAQGSPGVSNLILVGTSDGGALVGWRTNSPDMIASDTNNLPDLFVRKLGSDGILQPTQLVSQSTAGDRANGSSSLAALSGNGQYALFESDSSNFDNRDFNNGSDLFRRDLVNGTTTLVSINATATGTQNGSIEAYRGSISYDGRFVVFDSSSNNLVTQDTHFQVNVYLRDMQSGQTRLVSARADGTGAGGFNAAITPSGLFVAFYGFDPVASDVPSANGKTDVYLANIANPAAITVRMVSVRTTGGDGGNANSGDVLDANQFDTTAPQISDDGRYVAFRSSASDLVAGLTDATAAFGDSRGSDIFRRDMTLNQTICVSAIGANTGNSASYFPQMSADGKFVAFAGNADNLVPGVSDGNRMSDVFLRNVAAGVTSVASARSPLLPASLVVPNGGELLDASADGRYVLFSSTSRPELKPGVSGPFLGKDVYVRDRQTGAITLVSVLPSGLAGSAFFAAKISADGRYVVFNSNANNLDPAVTATNGGVYLRDLVLGTTRLVSRNTTNNAPANAFYGFDAALTISPNGRFATFYSPATNLVSGVTVSGGQNNLYIYDRQTDTLRMVTIAAAGGVSSNDNTSNDQLVPAFSGDSSVLIFRSAATNIDTGFTYTGGTSNVFAYNLSTFTNSLVSISTTAGVAGNANSGAGTFGVAPAAVSADGRFVYFASDASNLTALANGGRTQIYRRDLTLTSSAVTMVSLNAAGTAAGDGASGRPQLSSDGTKLLFISRANNFGTPSNNGTNELYLRDLVAGTTQMVSIGANNTIADNTDIPTKFQLDASGQYVAFISRHINLLATPIADGGAVDSLYLRDVVLGRTVLVNVNDAGTASGEQSQNNLAFLVRGSSVVFGSTSHTLIAGDRNNDLDIFAFDYAGAASIAGNLFNDVDGNGVPGGSEAGVPSWIVYLDTNGNHALDANEPVVHADAAGNFAFRNRVAGSYSVGVVVPSGYEQTTNPAFVPVTLASDTSAITGVSIGVRVETADLIVESVSTVPTAQPGDIVTVQWTDRNGSSRPLSGSWQETVFLSHDTTLDASDVRLTTLSHTDEIAGLASEPRSVDLQLPSLSPGTYYLIVQVDSRAQVAGDSNRANNVAASAAISTSIPTLTLGVAASGHLDANSHDRYFQFPSSPDSSMRLVVDSLAASGVVEVFVALNRVPTRGDFDFTTTASTPDQVLTIDRGLQGSYFVLVHGRSGAAASSNFSITASVAGFGVDSIDVTEGGNIGRVTVPVHGTNFTAATTAALKLGGTTIPAASIVVSSPTLLYATFDLNAKSPGAYTVELTKGAQTSTSPQAFNVVAGITAELDISLVLPEAFRVGRDQLFYVNYTNTSNVDIVAQSYTLSVDDDKALVKLADDDGYTGTTVQFLTIANEGPAGVLHPGQSGKLAFLANSRTNVAHDPLHFSLTKFADPTDVLDWNAVKDFNKPATLPTAAWDAVWSNFVASMGTTVADFERRLADWATYFSEVGIYTASVDRLWMANMQAANDAMSRLLDISSTDAALPTAGVPLTFTRTLADTVAGRYQSGPWGQGWSSNWDASASTDAAGNVSIQFGGGVGLAFTLQPTGLFAGPLNTRWTLNMAGGNYVVRNGDGAGYNFLPSGLLDYVVDAHGNRITAGYASGRLASLTHSSGASLALAYNGAGQLATITDSTGRITTYTYAAGQLSRVDSPFGTVLYTYDSSGLPTRQNAVTAIADLSGSQTLYSYDSQGRLIGQSKAGGVESVAYSYDAFLGLTQTTGGVDNTTALFNDRGQEEQVTDALGRVTQFDYDLGGNLIRSVAPDGAVSTKQYASGVLSSSRDALGNQLQFTYDPTSRRLLSVTDARGSATNYAYDSLGDLRAINYDDGSQHQFTYDPLGNPESFVNARGQTVDSTFNVMGLVASKSYSDGSQVTFTYNARGNILTATDAAGTIQFEYNASDLLSKVTYPGGRTLTFSYDILGRRTQSVDEGGFTVKYIYDTAGRLQELKDAANARIVLYTYDTAGRVIRKDLGNGTFTTYEFDAAGQLLHLVNHAPNTSVSSRFDYTYDAAGRRTQVSTLDGVTTYAYDANGQLVQATLPGNRIITFTYDASGNRTSMTDAGVTTTYIANAMNQITSAVTGGSTTTFQYDADGNLIQRDVNGSVTNFTWNIDSRLVGVSGAGGPSSYEYDPLGNRRAVVTGGVRTEFAYDPLASGVVTGEYVSGAVTARSVSGLGLVSRVTSGGAAYYDFDALGSTVALTNAAGAAVNRYSYSPFGQTIVLTAAMANPFTFVGAGYVQNDGDGRLFMQARTYDSAVGQFLSPDPIGLSAGDINIRRYVGNNPISFVDTSGLDCEADFSKINTKLASFYSAILSDASRGVSDVFQTNDPALQGAFKQLGNAIKFFNVYSYANSFVKHAQNGQGVHAFYDAFKIGLTLGGIVNPGLKATSIVANLADPFIGLALDSLEPPGGGGHGGSGGGGSSSGGGTSGGAGTTGGGGGGSQSVTPCDPNDITGPAGFGDLHWIGADALMPYLIRFENKEDASAPAQEVVVTSTLDPNLDPSTFELVSFAFGSVTIAVPAGRQAYSARVSYTSPMNGDTPLFVDVSAALDAASGVVTWSFRSVDPATGSLPYGAFEGFLPPNDDTAVGEGSVQFTIRPKANLGTGTIINQSATVVFDINQSIDTNIYTNQIDATAPTSQASVAAFQSNPNFTVLLSGSDGGSSGVAAYDVYVSVDNGPFTRWLAGTTQSSVVYPGVDGHTYGFFSVAIDGVGLRQPTPVAVQDSTQVLKISVKPPRNLTAIASALSHSDESYSNFITHAYQTYLGRSPDTAGLNGWLAQMRTGAVSDERLESFFVGSNEYIANHGGAGAGWVTGMYNDLLGRVPSNAEVNGWVQQLNSGVPAPTIAYGFAASAEREASRVRQNYLTYLGRSPSQAEVDSWVDQFINHGMTTETMAAGFVGSAEFFNNTAKGATTFKIWVSAAYQAILARTPSDAERNSIVSQLALPPNAAIVAAQLTHSDESYTNFIIGAYQKYLGRNPDAAGLNNWLTLMRSGQVSDERLEASFVGSTEYIANHGGAGAGWVTGMYVDLLGRSPSTAEVNGWVAVLNAGTPTTEVAYGFAASAEREAGRVRQNYLTYLGRSPSQAEVNSWVNEFVNHGLTNEGMSAGFVGSPEYFKNPTKGDGNAVVWLDAAFTDVLHRSITIEELLALIGILQ